jgi:CDP-paratose 2-epimerase
MTVLVVGGAGFIGTNLVAHLARAGQRVRVYDDLSRDGVDRNLAWLQKTYGDRVDARIADVRDRAALRAALDGVDTVFHLAAQVAVPASLVDPRHGFDVNARGTLELLEAVRVMRPRPAFVFASTSKVYGCLPDLALRPENARWQPIDDALAASGIDERQPLEFRTPYGCSRGCADQYVLDYAQSYGVPATVFRLSSVYGPHQTGAEDQGWVAHFLLRAISGAPITIYGDGRQVRDLLYVDDLVDAFVRAWSRISVLAGRAFNLGGGPTNTLGLLELVTLIETLRGSAPEVRFEGWRLGDQRYFVADTNAFAAATGWSPRVSPRAGIEALHGWLVANARQP